MFHSLVDKTRLGLVLLAFLISCTKKPSRVDPPHTYDGIYKKSDFISAPIQVSAAQGAVAHFIKAAQTREKPEKLQLLGESNFAISDGATVEFKIWPQYMRMYFVGNPNPVAEWAIQHCNVSVRKTDTGQNTRFNERVCDSGLAPDEYQYFATNINDVNARDIVQGTENYLALKSIKDVIDSKKTYIVKTGVFKIKGLSATRAETLELAPGFTGFNDLRPVEFDCKEIPFVTFNDKTLSTIDFLGKEHSQYQIRLRLTDHNLLIEKVVDESGVGPSEKTYAQKLGDGNYAVTIMGYPLTNFNYQPIELKGEKTVHLIPVSVDSESLATHVKIDQTAPIKFMAQEKVDVFSGDFFKDDSEWVYEKSLVDMPWQSDGENVLPGSSISSGAVRVFRTKNSVQFLYLNSPDNSGSSSGEKLQALLEIPANWVQYRVPKEGQLGELVEEAINDGHPAAHEWKNRPFVTFEFNRANHLQDSRIDQFKLKHLELGNDSILFDIFESQDNITYRYSLRKSKPASLKGRTYFVQDRDKFGYFRSVKNYYPGVITDWEDIQENQVSINRMYPEPDSTNKNQPTIWFHMSKDGIQESWLKDAVQAAVDAWNQAFAKAAEGTQQAPIAVKLSDRLVQTGDVRYNKVVFWGYDRNTGGVLGYGPSVEDERSGEIFSATNHIYLNSYRESIWNDLKQYIRSELGLYDKNDISFVNFPNQELSNPTTQLNSLSDSMLASQTKASMSAVDLNDLGFNVSPNEGRFYTTPLHGLVPFIVGKAKSYDIKAINEDSMFTRYDDDLFHQRLIHPSNSAKINDRECKFDASNHNTFATIKTSCDNKNGNSIPFREMMKRLRSLKLEGDITTHLDAEEMRAAFTSCSDILLKKKITSTLVHEFGHDFGLTHNFAGSADQKNFIKDKFGKILAATSSVMEYPHGDDDRITSIGDYDVAAIRYGYYDAVEALTKSGTKSVVDLKGQNIAQALAKSEGDLTLKPFKFCNEFNFLSTGYNPQMPLSDPNCRRWDRGVTSLEQVNTLIDDFHSSLLVNSNRFDDKHIATAENIANYLTNTYFIPLRIHYDHFRFLLQFKAGQRFRYLESLSTQKELDAKIKELNDPELNDYYASSRQIFKFLKELAFSPARYCKLVDANGGMNLFSFEILRKKYFSETQINEGHGVTINSCEEGKKWLVDAFKLGDVSAVTLSEVGNLFGDLTISENPTETLGEVDDQSRGLKYARSLAWASMTLRLQTSALLLNSNLTPSMLDEPMMRSEMINAHGNRIINGEGIKKFTSGMEKEQYLRSFVLERDLMENAHRLIIENAGSPESTIDRTGIMMPNTASRAEISQKQCQGSAGPKTCGEKWFDENKLSFIQDARGNYYYAGADQPIANMLITRIDDLNYEIENGNSPLITSVDQVDSVVEKLSPFVITINDSLKGKTFANFEARMNAVVPLLIKLLNDEKLTRAEAMLIVASIADWSKLETPLLIGELSENDLKGLPKMLIPRLSEALADHSRFLLEKDDLESQRSMLTGIVFSYSR